VGPIRRGPAFHHYADARTWLGIPHAGDVLSNLGFVVVAAWQLGRTRGFARLAAAGVAAIGIGSAAYHVSSTDMTLALDWGPIAITLSWIVAAVIADRHDRRVGVVAAIVGTLLALASIAYWLATGGTSGGDMTGYVAVQAAGVALPAAIALATPGRIPAPPLLVAIVGFGAARLCAARDGELLATLGVSGHSLKHVVAAAAALIALRALTRFSSVGGRPVGSSGRRRGLLGGHGGHGPAMSCPVPSTSNRSSSGSGQGGRV